jgi:hypothetical protein
MNNKSDGYAAIMSDWDETFEYAFVGRILGDDLG